MKLQRAWRDLRRQPRWWLWTALTSGGCTLIALMGNDGNHWFGGPVLHYFALVGTGVIVVLLVILLVLQARTKADHE
ncbi:hypothetical protein [Actinoplanes sp. M2I2]|uniref:hypothetical protein n=1 Tax=Actinoplanes sp. M2I2 TaxID=1734444 RepID=UPI002020E23F|nr:hypothetical protein [Actinoplanes sp. M2I2]